MSVIASSTPASAGAPSRLTNPVIPHICEGICLGRHDTRSRWPHSWGLTSRRSRARKLFLLRDEGEEAARVVDQNGVNHFLLHTGLEQLRHEHRRHPAVR